MNFENMYEGQDIVITLNNNELRDYILSKFLIKEKLNEHKKVIIEIETSIDYKKNMEELISEEGIEILIELMTIKGKRKIFNGLIDYFEVLEYGSGGCKILLKGFSRSILLDRKEEKKYRVFQDINMSYAEIIEEINKDYTEKKLEVQYSEISKRKINSLLVQYDETDWEFIVRLASHLKTGIFVTEQGIITFGLIGTNEIKEESRYFSDYSTVQNYKNIYYKVYSNRAIGLGDKVSLNIGKEEEKGKELIVLESKIVLENHILRSEFLSSDIENYKIYKKYNEKLRGSAIEVRVERVFEEDNIAKMEVEFFGGLKKIVEEKSRNNGIVGRAYDDYGVKRFSLSYQTFYSQSNTGFFCTPEVNDIVEVYFPNEDENFARVSWAINNNGNGRFSNPNNRNYHVGDSDFNMQLSKDNLSISAASSISQTAQSITENAESIVNKAKNYTERIEEKKSVLAQNIKHTATQDTTLISNNNTTIKSTGTSKVSAGGKVLING